MVLINFSFLLDVIVATKNATQAEVEDVMKLWFRHAGDRMRAQKK